MSPIPKHRLAPSTPIPAVPFRYCAAKTTAAGLPGTSVEEHCIFTGRVAEALFALLPESVRHLLPPAAGLAVSLHDVGKVSPGYELQYFRDSVVREHAPELCDRTSFCARHASISAAAIDRWLGLPTMSTPLAIAAAAHHGVLDRGYPPDQAEVLGGAAWADERRKLIEALIGMFGGSLAVESQANAWLLAGLTCVADWIGSDEQYFPADRPPITDGDPVRTAFHAVEACGFRPFGIKRGLTFEEIFGFQPRPAQQLFFEKIASPGVYVLEAPMGIGKTEAALYAAYRLLEAGHHHGLYFALPTRLTSDRIHERVAAFMTRISETPVAPRLAHGMAWLSDYRNGGEEMAAGEAWFNPAKRALLYPYAVGTIDQALLSVLNVRHGFVRLFGLAGKVVILDEVHSYDMYTGTLLDELVDRLQQVGCTVIILSATLTGRRRAQLAPSFQSLAEDAAYPSMAGALPDGRVFAQSMPAPESKRIYVCMEKWDSPRVAAAAVAAAGQGQCVVCIANTVAKAQTWYRSVKEAMPAGTFPVGILHARFPLFRRTAIEQEWMSRLGKPQAGVVRPRGCVLIATQIVEQSVDLDADLMVSELAPSDMLLQRMGRLWRHDRAERACTEPRFIIVTGDPGQSATPEEAVAVLGRENACVYAPYVLMRTHEVWRSLRSVRIPHDIRMLIEATYAERTETPVSVMGALADNLATRCERLRKLACSAKDTNRGFPSGADDEHAATRYSDLPSRSVLLLAARPEIRDLRITAVRLLDGSEWRLDPCRPDFEATRHLHASTLSIASHLLPERGRSPQEVTWLQRHFFDKPVVLIKDEDGGLADLNGHPTSLRYSPEYGVWRDEASERGSPKHSRSPEYTEDDGSNPFNTDW